MAALARLAERAVVHVRTAMTAEAIHRQLQIRRRLGLVAGLARDLLVDSDQWEPGLPRVVEAPQPPPVRIMATGALCPEPSLMEILVTALTGHRRVLVGRRAVALLARHRLVQAYQREARNLMIEGELLPPARIAVARLATFAQLALMRILLAVTGHARRRELVPIEVTGMATLAFHLGMGISQREARLVVIEADRLPFFLIVARLALVAEAAGMDVLKTVA